MYTYILKELTTVVTVKTMLRISQLNDQETQIKRAEGTITTMQGEMEHMRGKIEEALKLIDIAKKLEEKIVSVQHR